MTIRTTGLTGLISPKEFASLREQMNTLQMQLATGKKAQTLSGLGVDVTASLNFRTQMASIESYRQASTDVSTRLSVLSTAMTQFGTIGTDTKKSLSLDDFRLANGQTVGQKAVRDKLDQAIDLLNSEVNGRYLFSGRSTDIMPCATGDAIMNGDGTLAGFETVRTQRLTADIGGDLSVTTPGAPGYPTGRLTGTYLTAPLAAAPTYSIGLAEDGTHSFGLKFNSGSGALPVNAVSTVNGLTAVINTAGTGGKGITLTLDASAAKAEVGQKLTVPFSLPDGSTKDIVLTVADPSAVTLAPNEFKAGTTASETILNVQSALQATVNALVRTELPAASAMQAGNDFFVGDANGVPKRIDPGSTPNFATATAFTSAATAAATTVAWYKGDKSAADPRKTATVRVDQSVTVSYGMVAKEQAFTDVVKSLAVGSSMKFDANDTFAKDRYAAMVLRAKQTFSTTSTGTQTITTVHMEITNAQLSVKEAQTRNADKKNMLSDLLDGVEGTSREEVAAQMLALQTQLQASYQSASMMSKLTLTNYLN